MDNTFKVKNFRGYTIAQTNKDFLNYKLFFKLIRYGTFDASKICKVSLANNMTSKIEITWI